MSFKQSDYPADWKQISKRIRERAGNKCEICGVENGAWILRASDDKEDFRAFKSHIEAAFAEGLPNEFDMSMPIKVVLTVAHLNHDTTDNRDENLKALCQLHHLRHDAQYHAQNAAKTRKRKHEEKTGQKDMFAQS